MNEKDIINKNMQELIDEWYDVRDEKLATLTKEDRENSLNAKGIKEIILKLVESKHYKYAIKKLDNMSEEFLQPILYEKI